MPSSKIEFNGEEGLNFSLPQKNKTARWIEKVLKKEGKVIGNISYFFCTDNYLLAINSKFLHHNDYTDIITFDYTETGTINGEIFISIDRVKENAAKYKQPFQKELHRVIIHGALHLCGYKDKTAAEKRIMRGKEEEYLFQV